jgi:diaminopimelate decarboxylase
MAQTLQDAKDLSLADVLVGRYFGRKGKELSVGGIDVGTLAQTYGTPLYVYDGKAMQTTYRTLCETLAGFADVYYSVKANPNPEIAKLFVAEGAGLEIASGQEFENALKAGAKPGDVLFAGPGKSEAELEATIAQGLGEIHLECFEEIERVAAISKRLGQSPRIAIRVNPSKAAQGGAMRMGGKPAAFGFDEEIMGDVVAALKVHPHMTPTGIHLFAGTQILDADVLLTQWQHGLSVAESVSERFGVSIETVDLGGGLGVPYHHGDSTLDLERLGQGVQSLSDFKRKSAALAKARVMVEPGRFLTASGGLYLMQVLANKMSRGQRFLICNGGMHHHLAASGNLGQVFKKDYPMVAANHMDQSQVEPVSVCGPLCTPLDTLGRKTEMPAMEAGDLIAVLQSGAYGLTASPVGFLSHPLPAEVLVMDGTHRQI